MGINVDLGSVETAGRRNGKALAEGTWEAETVKFSYVKANTGTEGIEFIYKVTEDAVDIDGDEWKGKVWDKFWITEKTLKWFKSKLTGIMGEEEVNNVSLAADTFTEDLKDLVGFLNDDYQGVPVQLVTELEEDRDGKEYSDGTTKQYTRVVFVNEV